MRSGRGQGWRRKARLVLYVLVGCAPSLAWADDWTAFIPSPLDNGAYLDTYSSFERDHFRSGNARPTRWTDTFIREKLTLYSDGYSYDPRFLQYHLSVAGSLRQEDYQSSFQENVGWRYGEGGEYDVRLFFLPEHPYNLTLYASRFEPLFKEYSATQHGNVADNRGASFEYHKKPYFLRARYDDTSVDSGNSSSEVTTYGADGTYFKEFPTANSVSLTGATNFSDFSTSEAVTGHLATYDVNNSLNVHRVQLTSSLTKFTSDQNGGSSGDFHDDSLSWQELLSAQLPWNLRSLLTFRYRNTDSTAAAPGAAAEQTLSDTTRDLQYDLIHKLYQSLETRYTFLRIERSSSAGDTTALSNGLTLNYTKLIPWGRLLVGTNAATGETDNRGEVSIVNEPYSAIPVPGSFTLRQQNVNLASIVVSLKSPLPPFDTIRLENTVDYDVIPVGNSVEIHVLTLPAQFLVPGTFDFLVTYSLTTANFNLRTDTYGSNLSLDLFENLLTPYFSYVAVRSEVLSGVFPGVPLDSTTYTTGLIIHRDPLQLRGEYQKLEWQASPYEAWRAELQYVQPLNVTTSLYATASYENKHYFQGTSTYSTRPFTEERETGSGSIQKRFPALNMALSAGGSYSRVQGLTDSNAYALNGSWTWHIGKLDLSAGGSAYESDSSGTRGISTKRDHQFVYVRLRRKLL